MDTDQTIKENFSIIKTKWKGEGYESGNSPAITSFCCFKVFSAIDKIHDFKFLYLYCLDLPKHKILRFNGFKYYMRDQSPQTYWVGSE